MSPTRGRRMALLATQGMLVGCAPGAGGAVPTIEIPRAQDDPGEPPEVAAPRRARRDAHCCKGMNDCKGRGECKTDRHNCKGMNDCKGLGGCKPADCKKR